ncbi:MAG: 4a-hydroxytetrahydrobiopterin dehydratase [Pseudomonadota bacterium]
MTGQTLTLADLIFETGTVETPLPRDQRARLLNELGNAWQVEARNPDALVRGYRFNNFVEAMAFANRVCELAEQFDHHPALTIEYGRATVVWWTHTAGGIAANDFLLARETDALYNTAART